MAEMTVTAIRDQVSESLDDLKARNIVTLDVQGVSNVTDYMLIASGTSDRHVKSIADRVVMDFKAAGGTVIGIEGQQGGQWILIDLGDVVVHVMREETREFYQLERLWEMGADEQAAEG